jgi:hypothetical protein
VRYTLIDGHLAFDGTLNYQLAEHLLLPCLIAGDRAQDTSSHRVPAASLASLLGAPAPGAEIGNMPPVTGMFFMNIGASGQAAIAEVVQRLVNLLLGVHHEGPVLGNFLVQWPAGD